jgi:hypothetical protein
MVTHPWFRRVWTAQEMALGRNVIMMRGHHEITWNDFACSTNMFVNTRYPMDQDETESMMTYTHLQPFMNRLRLRQLTAENVIDKPSVHETSLHLRSLCSLVASSLATNPRDKVFGIQGMLERAKIPTMDIDYSLSPEEIFESFTRTIVQHSQALWVLSYLQGYGRTAFLPTWVPNWTVYDPAFLDYSLSAFSPVYANSIDSATRASPIHAITLASTRRGELHVKGLRASTIAECVRPDFVDPNLSPTVLSNHLKAWLDLCYHGCAGENAHQQLERLARLLSFGYKRFDLGVEQMAAQESTQAILHVMGPIQKTEPFIKMHWSARVTLLPSIVSQLSKRTLARTSLSQLAICTCLTQKGDEIVLLAGCPFPLVLRPHNGSFQIAGTAIVEGTMNGEAWPKDLDHDALETFILT